MTVMRIGLFIPCFIDLFYRDVGIATLELLERLGHTVEYPEAQTCCGQPMGNSGFIGECGPVDALFVRNFDRFDAVVCPSASCVHHVRNKSNLPQHLRARTYELVEFLHDVVGADTLPAATFPHRVTLHNGCTALRSLGHESVPELNVAFFSKPRALLAHVQGIELVETERADECCGFGGTFSVSEEAVSARMGQDKVTRQARSGAEFVVSADMSCLMHQAGSASRHGLDLRFIHIAQVLNA